MRHNFFYFQFAFKDVKFIEPQEQILAIANVGQVGIHVAAQFYLKKIDSPNHHIEDHTLHRQVQLNLFNREF